MEFVWDSGKAESNYKKHGVRFSEAATIWRDGLGVEMLDEFHSDDEQRWIRVGMSANRRVLLVVFWESLDSTQIRLISARKATAHERAQYAWRRL